MARSRAKSSTKEPWLQVQGQQPQGIEEGPARLQKAQQNDEPKHRLPSPPTTNPPNLKVFWAITTVDFVLKLISRRRYTVYHLPILRLLARPAPVTGLKQIESLSESGNDRKKEKLPRK
ncbi:MAG: hypothetical protein Q9196_007443, partial [Gyalolechia fulgens]